MYIYTYDTIYIYKWKIHFKVKNIWLASVRISTELACNMSRINRHIKNPHEMKSCCLGHFQKILNIDKYVKREKKCYT